MTASPPSAPLGDTGAAPAEDRPPREVLVGVDDAQRRASPGRLTGSPADGAQAALGAVDADHHLPRWLVLRGRGARIA